MEATIIEFDVGVAKDGKSYRRMNVLGRFNSYGKMKTSTVDVNLTEDEYDYYAPHVGKKMEFKFIIPLPQFPLSLESLPVPDIKNK